MTSAVISSPLIAYLRLLRDCVLPSFKSRYHGVHKSVRFWESNLAACCSNCDYDNEIDQFVRGTTETSRNALQVNHSHDIAQKCDGEMLIASYFYFPTSCFRDINWENVDVYKGRIAELVRQLAAARVQNEVAGGGRRQKGRRSPNEDRCEDM